MKRGTGGRGGRRSARKVSGNGNIDKILKNNGFAHSAGVRVAASAPPPGGHVPPSPIEREPAGIARLRVEIGELEATRSALLARGESTRTADLLLQAKKNTLRLLERVHVGMEPKR